MDVVDAVELVPAAVDAVLDHRDLVRVARDAEQALGRLPAERKDALGEERQDDRHALGRVQRRLLGHRVLERAAERRRVERGTLGRRRTTCVSCRSSEERGKAGATHQASLDLEDRWRLAARRLVGPQLEQAVRRHDADLARRLLVLDRRRLAGADEAVDVGLIVGRRRKRRRQQAQELPAANDGRAAREAERVAQGQRAGRLERAQAGRASTHRLGFELSCLRTCGRDAPESVGRHVRGVAEMSRGNAPGTKARPGGCCA